VAFTQSLTLRVNPSPTAKQDKKRLGRWKKISEAQMKIPVTTSQMDAAPVRGAYDD
jgi:hypothetical protein